MGEQHVGRRSPRVAFQLLGVHHELEEHRVLHRAARSPDDLRLDPVPEERDAGEGERGALLGGEDEAPAHLLLGLRRVLPVELPVPARGDEQVPEDGGDVEPVREATGGESGHEGLLGHEGGFAHRRPRLASCSSMGPRVVRLLGRSTRGKLSPAQTREWTDELSLLLDDLRLLRRGGLGLEVDDLAAAVPHEVEGAVLADGDGRIVERRVLGQPFPPHHARVVVVVGEGEGVGLVLELADGEDGLDEGHVLGVELGDDAVGLHLGGCGLGGGLVRGLLDLGCLLRGLIGVGELRGHLAAVVIVAIVPDGHDAHVDAEDGRGEEGDAADNGEKGLHVVLQWGKERAPCLPQSNHGKHGAFSVCFLLGRRRKIPQKWPFVNGSMPIFVLN